MKLVIKDEPREWRRFMLQFCALGLVLTTIMAWRGTLAVSKVPAVAGALVVLGLTSMVRPRWFRAFHRLAMVVSAWLGDRVGKVVLSVLFFVIVTPLGLILRLFGYDPLALRRRPTSSTYWQPVERRGQLDRMH